MNEAVDRPHPVLDLVCPKCDHAVRDHFGYAGPCAECFRTATGYVDDTKICAGLGEVRSREELRAARSVAAPADTTEGKDAAALKAEKEAGDAHPASLAESIKED